MINNGKSTPEKYVDIKKNWEKLKTEASEGWFNNKRKALQETTPVNSGIEFLHYKSFVKTV